MRKVEAIMLNRAGCGQCAGGRPARIQIPIKTQRVPNDSALVRPYDASALASSGFGRSSLPDRL